MARWQSGSRERLAEAAMRLFGTHGFEQTTVAEIAAEAGLTERTFFRYYADKREVLFTGQDDFEALFLEGLERTSGSDPMALVEAALDGAAGFFPEDKRPWSRARARIIAAHPALAEREQHKLSALADALTAALVQRGVEPIPAALAAQSGTAVFHRAFATWIEDGETRSFAEVQHGVLAELKRLLRD